MSDEEDADDAEAGGDGAATDRERLLERPSVEIVRAAAAVTGRDPAEGPPLYESVDADALDAILRHPADGATVSVTFTYDDVVVTVDSDGGVDVEAVAEEGE